MIIEGAFGVVSVTRNTLNQFAIRLENSTIGTGKMHAVGLISQCLMAHPAAGLQRLSHHGIRLLHTEERAWHRKGAQVAGNQTSFTPWPCERISGRSW